MKSHLCKVCGDTDPEHFYPTNKSRCRSCISDQSTYTPKPPKPHLCKVCGETDPDQFYPTNKGRCKRCTSQRVMERYNSLSPDDKATYKERVSAFQDNNMIHFRFMTARNRANKKKIDFNITEQYLHDLWGKQEGKCYYTQQAMVLARDNTKTGPSSYSVSIDRLDSSKGYVEGNVVLCCAAVNIMKSNLPMEEFKRLIELMSTRLDLF